MAAQEEEARRQILDAFEGTNRMLERDIERLRAEKAAALRAEDAARQSLTSAKASLERKKAQFESLRERTANRTKKNSSGYGYSGGGGGSRSKKKTRAPLEDDLDAPETLNLRQILHSMLHSKNSVTDAEAMAPYTEPTTLVKALGDCEKSQDVAVAQTGLMFGWLAKRAREFFVERVEDLEKRGDVSVADLVLLAKQKFSSEHFKMIAFVLYVDWLLRRFGFKWRNIQFTDWNLIDDEACWAKKKDHRILVGLQFLKARIKGNPVGRDLADDPECDSPLYFAMTLPELDPGDTNAYSREFRHRYSR